MSSRGPVGGQQSDVAAAANAVARAGGRGVTGAGFDEVDLFGLAGGVGFMVAVFEYEGFGPTMTITTRTVSMPGPFVEHGLARAGVDHEVATTGSAKVAAATLDEALAAGHQVLCHVETAALPYHGEDGSWLGAGPRVVGVLGKEGDDYLVDDVSPAPVRVSGAALAAARGAAKKAKHRTIVLTGPTAGHDPLAARAGLQRTVDGYDESPAKSFANNVGTNGLRTWATRLTATNAKGWARVFAEPRHLHYGLRRVVECIDVELTAPSASRPLYAAWLTRAAVATGEAAVADLAGAFETSATAWRTIVDLAAAQGDAALSGADATDLFAAMAEQATVIADVERSAVDALAGLLAG